MIQSQSWDLPEPHVLEIAVAGHEIDAYRHVNNAVYVNWCDRAAWHHSAALGLSIERCLELDRGMAVVRTVIRYLRPALLGDTIQVATWLLPAESRLCVRRRFQVRKGGATLVRAETEYACIELSSGRPARWPPQFHTHYVALPPVLAALETLPAL